MITFRPLGFTESIFKIGGDKKLGINVTLVASIQGPLTEKIFKDGLYYLQSNQPFLRTVFVERKGSTYFRLDRDGKYLPHEIIKKTHENQWQEVARQHRMMHLGGEGAYLWQATALLDQDTLNHEIILSLHHAICDGLSIASLMNQLICYFDKIYEGEEYLLRQQEAKQELTPCLESLLASPQTPLKLIFTTLWFKITWVMKGYRHLAFEKRVPSKFQVSQALYKEIDERLFNKIITYCHTHTITVNSLLHQFLTESFRHYKAKRTNSLPQHTLILSFTAINLRPFMKVKMDASVLGLLTNPLTYCKTMQKGDTSSLKEECGYYKQELEKSISKLVKRLPRKPYSYLFNLKSSRFCFYVDFLLSNLGRLDLSHAPRHFNVSKIFLSGSQLIGMENGMTIFCLTLKERMFLSFVYYTPLLSEESAIFIVEDFMKRLENLSTD